MADDLGFIPEESSGSINNASEGQDIGFQPEVSQDDNLGFIPDKQGTDYNSPEQQFITGAEGAAQGVLGPVAPYVETRLLGVDPEDIKARATTNPVMHGVSEVAGLVGGAFLPVGQAASAARIAGSVARIIPEVGMIGRVGSMALKGAIEGAALAGSENVSKYILGDLDPETPVASALSNMKYSALLGGAGGALFGTIGAATSKGLQAIEDTKLGNRAQSWLVGHGAAIRGENIEDVIDAAKLSNPDLDPTIIRKAFENQPKLAEKIASSSVKYGTRAALAGYETATSGLITGGSSIPLSKYVLEPMLERVLDRPMTAATQKFIMPTINRVLTSGETQGMGTALNFATQWDKGARKITNSLDSIFNQTSQPVMNSLQADDREKDKIDKSISEGVLQDQINNQKQADSQQGFAQGGFVQQQDNADHFANIFPVHDSMLKTAKTRVYNYLNTVKPSAPVGQLPYDKHEPTAEQKRTYDNALGIAASPLSILKHVKDNTLTAEHVKHFTTMWPEISSHLNKEITKRIVHNQVNGEKPSYKTRQSLSMLMGMPLESSFTPASIQAAQAVFIPKAPQQPAQGAPKLKRGTSKLGSKTNATYQTPDQNAESDRSTRS